jgi:hypothetical protein
MSELDCAIVGYMCAGFGVWWVSGERGFRIQSLIFLVYCLFTWPLIDEL